MTENQERRRRLLELALGCAGIALWMGLWEATVRAGVFDARDVPSIAGVFAELGKRMMTAQFWRSVGYSLGTASIGLGIAMLIGIPVGVLIGRSAMVQRALRPIVEFLRPIPGLTLIPLIVIVWGPNSKSVVFLVAFGCLWPMLVQVSYGVRQVDKVAVETGRAYGLNTWERIRLVEIPSAVPYLFTGLRICSSMALIIAVSAELIIGSPGLGSAIRQEQDGLAIQGMYALILAAGLLGVLVHVAFGIPERHYLRWLPQHREAA